MGRALDRRGLLRLGAAGLLAPALLGAQSSDRPLPPKRVRRFAVDLPLPEVLTPTTAGGVDRYVMTQRTAMAQVLPPGLPATPVWGYDGQFPGPTVHATRGRKVEVRQVNHLPDDVVVHLHGAASRPLDDGRPTQPIHPGGQRVYHYDNDQQAATLWYHDHADMMTSQHVYRGLAGLYLLHDPAEDALGLPAGAHDVPLVIQDRLFDTDGRMVYDVEDGADLLGNVMVVNGVAWPRLAVEARRYRFRLLVASNSRPYVLALEGGRPFTVVASDGGLLARPVPVRSLQMVAAERYDVVIDFSDVPAGHSVALCNQAESGPMGSVMRFDVVRRKAPDHSRVPARLADIRPLAPADAPVDRVWRFGRAADGTFVINGRPYDPARVDARPSFGSTEVWEFRTEGVGAFHPVHMHLVHFQVLSRDGYPPAPYERGWKDTVYVGEGSVVRVVARFRPHVGRYLLHCHNLVHEDHAMMTQFEVVAAATRGRHMTTTRTRTAVLGLALAGMVAVAPAADAAATAPTKVVKMTSSNMFMPMKLTITRGTTVKWSNTSFTTHNVTASSGAWASGNIDPGGTYSRTFKRAGTVRYHCTIHAGMTATIIVK